uniref:Ig-like domain-containing protein n=1 Tax=Mola mola TaxID=94237 RepID=A0A3Q3X518_MOLML
PLNGTVGGTIVFTTTLTPAESQFSSIEWKFGQKRIFFGYGTNTTAPEYEDRITLMSAGSLELRNLSLTDSGQYTVNMVTNTFLNGTTRLDVYVPISNVTINDNDTDLVEFNSSVRLSCSSSGSSPSFRWLNSSSEVTASDRVQLNDGGSTLTIVNVTRYDQGPFRCHVANPVSNGTSGPVNFIISYGPENTILSPLPQEHYEEGSDIILSCSAVSQPPAQLYWFMNGKQLNETGPDLKLLNIQTNQSGNYSCRAFNPNTLRYDTSQFSVLSVISGTSVTPSTNLPIEGNSVNLTCEAAGSVFSRMWMKDGSALNLSDNMNLYEQNSVLSFNTLDKRDSGEYSCRVSNPISAEVAQYTLAVNYGPENVQIKGPAEIQFGQTLTLSCSAESRPSASYNWTLNGTLIEGQNSSLLTKAIRYPEDSGNYTCHAVNFVTDRSLAATRRLSITGKLLFKTSSCSAGCIAGIVIACIVVIVAAAAISYYICKTK